MRKSFWIVPVALIALVVVGIMTLDLPTRDEKNAALKAAFEQELANAQQKTAIDETTVVIEDESEVPAAAVEATEAVAIKETVSESIGEETTTAADETKTVIANRSGSSKSTTLRHRVTTSVSADSVTTVVEVTEDEAVTSDLIEPTLMPTNTSTVPTSSIQYVTWDWNYTLPSTTTTTTTIRGYGGSRGDDDRDSSGSGSTTVPSTASSSVPTTSSTTSSSTSSATTTTSVTTTTTTEEVPTTTQSSSPAALRINIVGLMD